MSGKQALEVYQALQFVTQYLNRANSPDEIEELITQRYKIENMTEFLHVFHSFTAYLVEEGDIPVTINEGGAEENTEFIQVMGALVRVFMGGVEWGTKHRTDLVVEAML